MGPLVFYLGNPFILQGSQFSITFVRGLITDKLSNGLVKVDALFVLLANTLHHTFDQIQTFSLRFGSRLFNYFLSFINQLLLVNALLL
jgi:hypothetical protein